MIAVVKSAYYKFVVNNSTTERLDSPSSSHTPAH